MILTDDLERKLQNVIFTNDGSSSRTLQFTKESWNWCCFCYDWGLTLLVEQVLADQTTQEVPSTGVEPATTLVENQTTSTTSAPEAIQEENKDTLTKASSADSQKENKPTATEANTEETATPRTNQDTVTTSTSSTRKDPSSTSASDTIQVVTETESTPQSSTLKETSDKISTSETNNFQEEQDITAVKSAVTTQIIEAKTVAGVVSASQSQATNLVASQVLASVRATGTASDATAEEPASKELVSTDQDGKSLKITYIGTLTENDSLKFAVWSENNDQDDLRWYDASTMGTALASYANHKGFGSYNVHTYSFEGGQAHGLSAITVTVPKPNVSTAVDKVNDSAYKITVSNVPKYISSIVVPIFKMSFTIQVMKVTTTFVLPMVQAILLTG